MRLCGLSEIEALLPGFLGLDHFVSKDGLEDIVSLVVVVHAGTHLASILARAFVYHVGHLLAGQSVRLLLQSALQLTHVR